MARRKGGCTNSTHKQTEQKKNILETIIKHKQEPDLKRVWDNLGEAYIAQPIITGHRRIRR
jgi:hypothetical protein